MERSAIRDQYIRSRDVPGLRFAPPGLRKNYAPKLFGDPATGVLPPLATFITASPRSLEPSERNRNRPSMPAKPDGLVSVSGANRWLPCFDSPATSATAS